MASTSVDNKWIGWPFQGNVKEFFNNLPETGSKVEYEYFETGTNCEALKDLLQLRILEFNIFKG